MWVTLAQREAAIDFLGPDPIVVNTFCSSLSRKIYTIRCTTNEAGVPPSLVFGSHGSLTQDQSDHCRCRWMTTSERYTSRAITGLPTGHNTCMLCASLRTWKWGERISPCTCYVTVSLWWYRFEIKTSLHLTRLIGPLLGRSCPSLEE